VIVVFFHLILHSVYVVYTPCAIDPHVATIRLGLRGKDTQQEIQDVVQYPERTLIRAVKRHRQTGTAHLPPVSTTRRRARKLHQSDVSYLLALSHYQSSNLREYCNVLLEHRALPL
jgi:transposase